MVFLFKVLLYNDYLGITKVKVALIDNSLNPSVYNPVLHWGRYLSYDWKSFRAPDHHLPDLSGNSYSHLILTGSEASILDRESWVYEEIEIIQKAHNKGLSILGSCYGHQLIALALLGSSSVRRSKIPEIGWIPIHISKENDFSWNQGEYYSFSVHFDEVCSLDDRFHIFASSEQCDIQAFQMKNEPVWGFQIHPEIDVLQGKQLLKELSLMNTNKASLYEEALRSQCRDSGMIHQIIKQFLQQK